MSLYVLALVPDPCLLLHLVLLQVARTVTIGLFYPLLSTGRVGYAMNWRTALVMIWAGLRGAVSVQIAIYRLLYMCL
jgi:NhaP-type Na+/H+ or K+/H+ antiporter